MNVLIYDPYVDPAKITAAGCEAVIDLDTALPGWISSRSIAQKSRDDRHVQCARLAKMKKGAFIVNTARGGIINEPDLHAALAAGISPALGWMCSIRSRRRRTIRC